MNQLSTFIRQAVRPRSQNEDRARREFILNVLLLGALSLVFVAIADETVHLFTRDPVIYRADSLSLFALGLVFAGLAALYALSIRGYALVASFVILAMLFDLAAYMGYRWGVDLAASLLFYALVITMAGILISARFGFITAVLAGASIGITVHLHRFGVIHPDRSWIMELWESDDVLVATLIFLIIALVMWLSNREIEKSLARARRSEAELRMERDLLEVRVEERTRELRQAELERMTQAYRFVEFGRLATGIFHDLMNPLAGLTLNIDRIAASTERTTLADDVSRAKSAAEHMQGLLSSMRPHVKREQSQELFSIAGIAADAIRLMDTYARERSVELALDVAADMRTFGDPVALTQALMNLLGNAVQSYAEVTPGSERRPVSVSITGAKDAVHIQVQDYGQGIAPESFPCIFEPYFTTKGNDGIGLGLSMVKRIAEKDFGGSISVESSAGEGTTFTLYLPIREP